jgi:hypothetical protein
MISDVFPAEDEGENQDGNQDGDPKVVQQNFLNNVQLLDRDEDDSDLEFTPAAAGTTVYNKDSDNDVQYVKLVLIGGESDSEEVLAVPRTPTPPPHLPEVNGPRPRTCGADGERTTSGGYCNNAHVAGSSRCRWHS